MDEAKTSNKGNYKRQRIMIWLSTLIVATAAFAGITSRTHTPQFLDENGNVLPKSIAEERQVMIGGVEQYVLLRGEDHTAPLLVFVHGGPGASATPFLRTYNAVLEEDFLVVYWDQRGAAKSYHSDLDTAEMNIARMTADLGELIDLLLAEFNQDQVLLVGHSWGTILALEHAATRPETVAAYISVSQTTNQLESDTEGYRWALEQARTANNESAITDLEAIGPPPYTIEEFITQRRYVNLLGGGLVEPQSDLQLLQTALATDEFSWADAPSFVRGTGFSGRSLWAEQQSYDAHQRHSGLEVPIYLIYGRHDKIISPPLGTAYFSTLETPHKELIWFEESAHSPLFEEPEKFNSAVYEIAEEVGLLGQ